MPTDAEPTGHAGHAGHAGLAGPDDAAALRGEGEDGAERDQPRCSRRGRRRAGADTRAGLVDAARTEFAERGYDGATVRIIAERAGVDAAMVNHWFGGKDGLFVAALEVPVRPAEILPQITHGDPERLAERILRTFLALWDRNGGGAMAALLRSVSGHAQAAALLRELIGRLILRGAVAPVAPDQPELRASLAASQIAGLGLMRYVVRLEPLASADHETVVAAIAPNLQRYLTGSLSRHSLS